MTKTRKSALSLLQVTLAIALATASPVPAKSCGPSNGKFGFENGKPACETRPQSNKNRVGGFGRGYQSRSGDSRGDRGYQEQHMQPRGKDRGFGRSRQELDSSFGRSQGNSGFRRGGSRRDMLRD
jgi:hypothetical protein